MRRLRFLSFICLVLCVFISCREPELTGDLEINFPDSSSKSIVPVSTKVTWITVEGSLNGNSGIVIPTQKFALEGAVDIKGLATGSWTIIVKGYNGEPDNGGVAVTAPTSQVVAIASGKTTKAVFSLHYLTTGTGTASVSVSWPNHSVTEVALLVKNEEGNKVAEATSPAVDGNAMFVMGEIPVGNYDLDLTLENASGSVLNFPMIDMVSVFNDLTSQGTVSLVNEDVPNVASPTFFATEDGSGVTSRTVTIASATPNATIFFTTDGTEPAFTDQRPSGSTRTYVGPFSITAPVTVVKALASKDGYQDSDVSDSEEFVVSGSDEGAVDITKPTQISDVTITSTSEVYLENPSFAVTYQIQGALTIDSIRWYLDGNLMDDDTDDDNAYAYDGYLTAGRHQISVKIAYTDGQTQKNVMGTLRFNNNGQVAKPVVLASAQNSKMLVSLSTETAGATIHYTTDDTDPTEESAVYEAPFEANEGTTVQAMATAEDYRASEVVCTLVDNDGTVTVEMPASVTNISVRAVSLTAQQPQFAVSYDTVNVENETVSWYIDDRTDACVDTDGDGNAKTFTYSGTLSAGRHQIRAKITYMDGNARLFATGTLRFETEAVATPAITQDQTDGGWEISLSCDTSDAQIYYSTTGNDPQSANSNQRYDGSFVVADGTIVKAFAVKDGMADSSVAAETITYKVGDTGPAGGLIFLIADGTCYEAAPKDEDGTYVWGGYETFLGGTGTAVGTGMTNTDAIVTALESETCAAAACAKKTTGGYGDWFLPSKDELDALYDFWKETGKGSFGDMFYWSSSEDTAYVSWTQNFENGKKNYGNSDGSKSVGHNVRAIRAF